VNHTRPIRDLLDRLAMGDRLTDEDLADLDLDDGVDRNAIEQRIREAATEIRTLRSDDTRQAARMVARDTVNELAALVDPGREPPPVPGAVDHPALLAAQIPRR
jgi:hypothetical protein